MTGPRPPAVGTGRRAAPVGRAARRTRATRVRRVVALAGALTRRRATRDAWLLLAVGALVAVTATLAVGGPRLVTRALDDATLETVAALGRTADPRVTASVRTPLEGEGSSGLVSPEMFLHIARAATPPAGLVAVTDEVVVGLDAGSVGVLTPPDGGPATARVALLPEGLVDDVVLVAGRLPAGTADDEVVVPSTVAERFGLTVGTDLDLAGPPRTTTVPDPATGEPLEVQEPTPVPVSVVGVVDPVDAADPVWRELAFAWRTDGEATLLAGEVGAGALVDALGALGIGSVRTVLDPAAFTLERAEGLVAALDEIDVDPDLLTGGVPGVRVGRSEAREALDAHLAAVPAARAQISVPLTGVVGAAALVLVLVSRLLVRRRADAIALERARGASVPSVTLRLLLESAVVVGLGTAAGVLASALLVPGTDGDVVLVALVVAVALLATPVQGAVLARRAWTGRRAPANRRERERVARRRALRRVVAEVGVVLLALGAGWSLRGRGLVSGSGIVGDPFLAVAPLLMALAMTVIALRVYPWPVRAVARLARPSRGVLGVLGAARAGRALEPLPLLALTVGTSVAVTGLLLVGTVRSGQVDASWDRTGAEARLEGPDLGPALDGLRSAPGVTAVAVALTADAATVDLGAHTEPASVIAVDAGYVELLAQLPDPPADVAALAGLAEATGADGADGAAGGGDGADADRLAAVVDDTLAPRVQGGQLELAMRGTLVPVAVVGTTDHAPRGEAPGPFVYVDLAQLGPHLKDGPVVDTVWLQGPGAVAAATAAAAELDLPPDAVHSRATWLADRRAMGLVSGVEQAMVVATGTVGVLAILALGATVLAGARERGRTLSLLRTLGMRARLGWWLALAELVPVVTAAVVAGAASGLAVVLLLGGALGLDVLVGGVDVPPVAVSGDAFGWLAAGAAALLLAAALVEVAAHRRDRLSEVLRVGETTT